MIVTTRNNYETVSVFCVFIIFIEHVPVLYLYRALYGEYVFILCFYFIFNYILKLQYFKIYK